MSGVVDSMTSVPALPSGYCARAATLDDMPGVVAVFNAWSRDLLGIDEYVVADHRHNWQLPGFSPATDSRAVFTPDGELIGCVEVWDMGGAHVRICANARVHPAHRGRGITRYLWAWAETRVCASVPLAPAGTRVTLLAILPATDARTEALLREAGFACVRHSWRMDIELDLPPPAPEWPAGITLRTFVPGQDEHAAVTALRESFRDHWGYVENPFEEDLAHFIHEVEDSPEFDRTLCFLAFDDNEAAGIARCTGRTAGDPDMGWVDELGVRRPWRRRGLGLALLRHCFGELHRRGRARAGLGVDAENITGATRLYERAGMHVQWEYRQYEKEMRPGTDPTRRM